MVRCRFLVCVRWLMGLDWELSWRSLEVMYVSLSFPSSHPNLRSIQERPTLTNNTQLYKSTGLTHTIFGTVLIFLFLIQPFLGILHHLQYRKSLNRAPISYAHIWYGRILMLCGIINGGLGLKLAANTKKGKIAYGVVAGAVVVGYAVLVGVKRKGRPTAEVRQRGTGEGLRIRGRRLFGGKGRGRGREMEMTMGGTTA